MYRVTKKYHTPAGYYMHRDFYILEYEARKDANIAFASKYIIMVTLDKLTWRGWKTIVGYKCARSV